MLSFFEAMHGAAQIAAFRLRVKGGFSFIWFSRDFYSVTVCPTPDDCASSRRAGAHTSRVFVFINAF
jgi:hypothetical protein